MHIILIFCCSYAFLLKGHCTFSEFLHASWKAGVIEYEVDFITRKVNYYGANGESYLEEYPAVEIKR